MARIYSACLKAYCQDQSYYRGSNYKISQQGDDKDSGKFVYEYQKEESERFSSEVSEIPDEKFELSASSYQREKGGNIQARNESQQSNSSR